MFVLLVLLALAYGRPEMPPHFGPQISESAMRRGEHHFASEKWHSESVYEYEYVGTYIASFKYRGTRAPRMIILDHEAMEVDAVTCDSDGITLHFQDAHDASRFEGNLQPGDKIIGNPQWGCGMSFIKIVEEVVRRESGDMSLELIARSGGLQDAWRHLNMTIDTAVPQVSGKAADDCFRLNVDAGITNTPEGALVESPLANFFLDIFNAVKNLLQKFISFVSTAFSVIKKLAQGQFHGSKTCRSVMVWDVSGKELGPIKTTSGSQVKFTPQSITIINIDNYVIQNFKLEGSVSFDILLNLEAKVSKTFTKKFEKPLGSKDFGSFYFSIAGFPLVIVPRVELNLVARLEFELAADIRLKVMAHPYAMLRISKESRNERPRRWFAGDLGASIEKPSFKTVKRVTASVAASLALEPCLVLVVDYIGGPYLKLSAGVEAVVNTSSAAVDDNWFVANFFVGVMGGFKAQLPCDTLCSAAAWVLGEIEIYKHKVPFYSIKLPNLGNLGGRELPSPRVVDADFYAGPGTTYLGSIVPVDPDNVTCAFWNNFAAEFNDMTLTIIDVDGTSAPSLAGIDFRYSVNDEPNEVKCSFNAIYDPRNVSGGPLPAYSNEYYAACTNGSFTETLLNIHDGDLDSITFGLEDPISVTVMIGQGCARALLFADEPQCTVGDDVGDDPCPEESPSSTISLFF